jgi:uncharacterized Tic20 family protein
MSDVQPTPVMVDPGLSPDDRLWAMLAHLAGLLGYAIGLGQYIAPLIIYLMFREKSRFVAFHALQSLYFQLALLASMLVLGLLTFASCGWGIFVTAPAAIVISLGGLIYIIIAAIKAQAGEWYEYWLVGKWALRNVGG